MPHVFETWLCICFVALLTGTSLASTDDNARDDDNIRSWNMLRLGRGLQMLRLGKRSNDVDSSSSDLAQRIPLLRKSRSIDDTDNSNRLSSNDLQALLSSILDEPRDPSRRQPPLPRYGRDNSYSRRDLFEGVSSDDSGASLLDFFPVSNSKLLFRPAPRGGRYKRSLPITAFIYDDLLLPEGASHLRAVPLPRFGRFLQTKAVPRPRIGREGLVVDSSNILSP